MIHGSCDLPIHDKLPIIIRNGRKEDEPFIKEFTRNTFSWGDYVGDAFSGWLNEPGEVLVAEFQGQIVGVTHVSYLSPTEAWFEGIRVHPGFRRMGIGMLLSRASIKAAREHGCTVARCAIDSTNTASSGLAKRLGFRLVGKLREFVRSFNWGSLVTGLGEQTTAGGNGFKLADENEMGNAALVHPAVGQAETAHARLGARRSSAFTVRKAEEKDFAAVWSKASREIRYIGSDFRWRSLSPENVRRAISSGNLVVAVNGSGMVEAGASISEVWEERKDSRLSGLHIETSSVFGSKEGIRVIVQHAVELLRKKALSLSSGSATRDCHCEGAMMSERPSGQVVVSCSVEQGYEVARRDLSFKVYSLCETTSPAQKVLVGLGFRSEAPDYLQPVDLGTPVTAWASESPITAGDCSRVDGIICEEGVIDYHVGLWEMEL